MYCGLTLLRYFFFWVAGTVAKKEYIGKWKKIIQEDMILNTKIMNLITMNSIEIIQLLKNNNIFHVASRSENGGAERIYLSCR